MNSSHIDHFIPISDVLALIAKLNGPAPTDVYALTDILYSTYSCKPVRITLLLEADILTTVEYSTPINVSSGTYKISNVIRTPLRSICWTSSHITPIVVEEMENIVTLKGGLEGTGKAQGIITK